jgi:hypothetical protein
MLDNRTSILIGEIPITFYVIDENLQPKEIKILRVNKTDQFKTLVCNLFVDGKYLKQIFIHPSCNRTTTEQMLTWLTEFINKKNLPIPNIYIPQTINTNDTNTDSNSLESTTD